MEQHTDQYSRRGTSLEESRWNKGDAFSVKFIDDAEDKTDCTGNKCAKNEARVPGPSAVAS